MAQEIERKFLVTSQSWRQQAGEGVAFHQGYLSGSKRSSVRVRIEGDQANINIKGATMGIERQEFEYPIPLADAQELLGTLCDGGQLKKRRYRLPVANHVWEIDCFEGDNSGLIVAEIELNSVDEPFERPEWLGEEVSEDIRYYNSRLIHHPYSEWRTEVADGDTHTT